MRIVLLLSCSRAALAVAALLGLACSMTTAGLQGRAISVEGDYLHPATQVRFPDRIDAFARTKLIALDADATSIGAAYAESEGPELVVSLYPAGDPIAGRLRSEFLRARGELKQGAIVALVDRTAVVRAPRPDGRAVGFESELRLMVAASGVTERALLQVFQCGRYFLRLVAVQAEDAAAPLRAGLDALHEQVPCQAIAERLPSGVRLQVGLDPEIRESDDQRSAAWIAHGFAQLEWIERHVPKQDLVFGIPDHDPALYLSAWQKTLALHERLVRDGGIASNPFLERLERVQQAGYLEEYVWTEYVGFLDAPDERRLRLDRFLRWRDARLPELRHEVHAAAQLKAAPD